MSFHHCEGLERLVSLPTIIDWGLARTTEAYCGETPNHQSWGSTLGILEQIRQGGGGQRSVGDWCIITENPHMVGVTRCTTLRPHKEPRRGEEEVSGPRS